MGGQSTHLHPHPDPPPSRGRVTTGSLSWRNTCPSEPPRQGGGAQAPCARRVPNRLVTRPGGRGNNGLRRFREVPPHPARDEGNKRDCAPYTIGVGSSPRETTQAAATCTNTGFSAPTGFSGSVCAGAQMRLSRTCRCPHPYSRSGWPSPTGGGPPPHGNRRWPSVPMP
jgi:hypothetical protein